MKVAQLFFSLGQEYFAVGHSRQERTRVTVFEN
jgi:hypothetical protein